MITRYPTRDPRPITRSVFDIRYTKRKPTGILRAVCTAAIVAFVAGITVAAHVR